MTKLKPRLVAKRDEKYMALAFCIARIFSKDPSTQCGTVIVGVDNTPLSYGYNGPPRKYVDDAMDWSRPAKYSHILHSEVNAIRFAQSDVKGATLYVTAKPCKNCMIDIAAAEIGRVVYYKGDYHDSGSSLNSDDMKITDEIAKNSQIKIEEFKGDLSFLRDEFRWMEQTGILS